MQRIEKRETRLAVSTGWGRRCQDLLGRLSKPKGVPIGAGRVDWQTESTGRMAYLFVNLRPTMMILRLTIAEGLAADPDVEESWRVEALAKMTKCRHESEWKTSAK